MRCGGVFRFGFVFLIASITGSVSGLSAEEKPEASIDLEPQPVWHSTMATDLGACKELYALLRPKAEPNGSLTATEQLEIFGGVWFMMSLDDAIKQLGLDGTMRPARSPIVHPGIPFYFRPFSTSKVSNEVALRIGFSSVGAPERRQWDLVYLITDNQERVVSVLLVSLAPKHPVVNASESEYLFFNHPLSKRRSSTITTVWLREDETDDVIEIDFVHKATRGTSNYSTSNYLRDTKVLEENRWFVPKRLAEFLVYVLEIKLGLAKKS